jgi:hypothetical protein
MRNIKREEWVGRRFPASCLVAVLLSVPLGCGAGDQFSAESDDEYTEVLNDAVIGTPTGVTTISASGEVSQALPIIAADSGSGGSTGGGSAGSGSGKAGSSPGTGGKAGSAGFGASAGEPSEGGAPDPGSDGGFGLWHFDDCSPTSRFMLDSSGFGAHAQQALKASCVPGISGLGVKFRSQKDVVQVPDQPQFTVGQHVGVAAWINPKTVSGDQPIVIKRLNNKTAFSLGVHKGNIEMSVVLSTGQTIISRAPIAANQWTHVAGMYDGTFVFLFINGQQFGQVYGAGTVRDVFAPIRIGATTQSQFFDGAIDEVFLTTQTITPDALTSLSCIGRPSTLSVNPASSGPVPPDTTVHYDLSVKNNDVGACREKQYDVFFNQVDQGFSAELNASSPFALPGATATFRASLTGSEDADPGLHTFRFTAFGFSESGFEQLQGQLSYELTAPTGCFVRTRRELMITDVSVVDDPIRAAGSVNPSTGGFPFGSSGGKGGEPSDPGAGGSFGTAGGFGTGGSFGTAGGFGTGGSFGTGGAGPGTPQTAGVWSFGHLMREMAPTPEAAPAMTLKLLQTWLTNQTVNGFTIQARPAMQQQLIDIWPKTPDGELDLDQSPLTLQAIVNRIDVRNLAEGSAGQGRFVYGVNGGINFQNFTIILEYNLVAHTQADVDDWASRWHALGALPFPSEEYNAALEAVTRRFTDHGAAPGNPNGSALVELRTNEIALSFQWEFRSFVLSPDTGMFAPTTVKETPDLSFNNTSTFANFVNQNAEAIIAEVPGGDSHTVPLQFEGKPFMGGSVFNNSDLWNGPGISNPDARFHASLNTCNGCHSPETNTKFLIVIPRFPGSEAQLSPFMTGTTVFDRFTGQTRTLNDLGRRKTDLTALVCASTPPTP